MSRVLYGAPKSEFKNDVITHRFGPKMQVAANMFRLGYGNSELGSWLNNAPQVKDLLDLANIPDDTYVTFEYKVPNGPQRIDCMLYGHGLGGKKNVVHLELKQWSNNTVQEIYSTGVFATKAEVEALTGGRFQPVPHPSQQVANYQQYLKDYVVVLSEDCELAGMAYCYNYISTATPAALYSDHYKNILDSYPLFSGDQVEQLAARLNTLLSFGDGLSIFNRVQDSPILPSKNLMDAAANMFKGITEFHLLKDQLVASNAIFAEVAKTIKDNEKTVIVVKGGPGTGKTVIALNILAQLAQGKQYPNIFFTTRSKALRNNLCSKLDKIKLENRMESSASNLIRRIYDFKPYHFKEGEVDVLLIDEAHRISNSSNHMSDKKYMTTHLSQTMSLIYCSKVCVFFIDDNQAITNSEIGKSDQIKLAANEYCQRLKDEEQQFRKDIEKMKSRLIKQERKRSDLVEHRDHISSADFIRELIRIEKKIKETKDAISKEDNITYVKSTFSGNVKVLEFELKSQFRCNGSDNYLDWLDESIYKNCTGMHTTFDPKDYDFRIYDSPQALYNAIRLLDRPASSPNQSARLAAGYCWKWEGNLTPEGDLEKEVVIGDFAMPWETLTRPRMPYRDMYASSADTWALEPAGINQIGCVFSIQGLEIDYIGVIIGPDLVYDSENDCLKAVPGITHNMNAGDNPDMYVKNIYRVLMSRGKKGCYIYSCDPEVSSYFRRCLGWTL